MKYTVLLFFLVFLGGCATYPYKTCDLIFLDKQGAIKK